MILVRRVEDYRKVDDFIREAFEIFKPEFQNEVIVKPNFLKFDSPANGCITHPEVVKATAEILKENGHDVIIAEGGFYEDSADECFQEFGLYEIAECININRQKMVSVDINGKALKSAEMGEIALKAMKMPFVSLPKMKVHTLAKTTLGIKNNMGFLRKPAMFMHLKIHQKLVDLLHVLNPEFVIVDGIIGGANSESNTVPVDHGVMIAGNSVIEVDAVSSYLMGFEPESIGYIRKAAEEFEVNLEGIEIRGDDPEGLRRDYRRNIVGKVLGMFDW
mgnify:CR=1 FL=1